MLFEPERCDKYLAAILKMLLLVYNFGISLGVILLLVYCASIDYYPTGITIADGFVFVAVCLSFASGYLLVTAGLFCAGVTVTPVSRRIYNLAILCWSKIKGKEVDNRINFPKLSFGDIPVVLGGGLMLLVCSMVSLNDSDLGFGLFMTIVAMSAFHGLWYTTPKRQQEGEQGFGRKFKIGLVVMIIFMPVVTGKIHGVVLKNAIRVIGIRTEGVTVQLEQKYAKLLELSGVEPAKIKGGKIPGYYTDVTVSFHGIGANDVIEVGGVRLIVPKSAVTIAKKIKS